MKPPAAPPPLTAMAGRKAELEAARAEQFPKWKDALEAANGNITKAGESQDPPLNYNQACRQTRRLGLVEYAAQLRLAAGGTRANTDGARRGKVMGRPKLWKRPALVEKGK